MALSITRRRFTVAEYYRMAETGILTEDDRVELIEGEIIEMTPIGPRHAAALKGIIQLFAPIIGRLALAGVQDPIRLSDHSEPQPDFTLLRLQPGRYASGHPTPADVLLVVEVADTTSGSDRRLKIPLYARHGIPEVWLVDLPRETIIVYRDPSPDGYRTVEVYRRGDQISPAAFPEIVILVDDILG